MMKRFAQPNRKPVVLTSNDVQILPKNSRETGRVRTAVMVLENARNVEKVSNSELAPHQGYSSDETKSNKKPGCEFDKMALLPNTEIFADDTERSNGTTLALVNYSESDKYIHSGTGRDHQTLPTSHQMSPDVPIESYEETIQGVPILEDNPPDKLTRVITGARHYYPRRLRTRYQEYKLPEELGTSEQKKTLRSDKNGSKDSSLSDRYREESQDMPLEYLPLRERNFWDTEVILEYYDINSDEKLNSITNRRRNKSLVSSYDSSVLFASSPLSERIGIASCQPRGVNWRDEQPENVKISNLFQTQETQRNDLKFKNAEPKSNRREVYRGMVRNYDVENLQPNEMRAVRFTHNGFVNNNRSITSKNIVLVDSDATMNNSGGRETFLNNKDSYNSNTRGGRFKLHANGGTNGADYYSPVQRDSHYTLKREQDTTMIAEGAVMSKELVDSHSSELATYPDNKELLKDDWNSDLNSCSMTNSYNSIAIDDSVVGCNTDHDNLTACGIYDDRLHRDGDSVRRPASRLGYETGNISLPQRGVPNLGQSWLVSNPSLVDFPSGDNPLNIKLSEQDFTETLAHLSHSVITSYKEKRTHRYDLRKEEKMINPTEKRRYYLDEEEGELAEIQENSEDFRRLSTLVNVISRLRKLYTVVPLTSQAKDGTCVKDNENNAILRESIENRPSSEVKNIMNNRVNVDINTRSESGLSSLHRAAEEGDIEAARMLMEHEADPDANDRHGYPPVHYALQHYHYKTAMFLMDCGTDIMSYTSHRIEEFLKVKAKSTQYLRDNFKTTL